MIRMRHLLVNPFGVFIFGIHLLPSMSISVKHGSSLVAISIFLARHVLD